jgi:hypothetical protein
MPKFTYPEVDYGPLARLVGVWKGDKGHDHSPAPAPENHTDDPYFETITIEDAGALKNGKEQEIAMVRYHQVVSRKSDGGVFHDQVGFWMWEVGTNEVMHSVSIPRGLALVAGGTFTGDPSGDGPITFTVAAKDGDPDYGISQSPFLQQKAKTTAFAGTFTVGPEGLHYEETTSLEIYGRSFEHTDTNTLSLSE